LTSHPVFKPLCSGFHSAVCLWPKLVTVVIHPSSLSNFNDLKPPQVRNPQPHPLWPSCPQAEAPPADDPAANEPGSPTITNVNLGRLGVGDTTAFLYASICAAVISPVHEQSGQMLSHKTQAVGFRSDCSQGCSPSKVLSGVPAQESPCSQQKSHSARRKEVSASVVVAASGRPKFFAPRSSSSFCPAGLL
jgi:hypothetical protein